MVWLALTNSHPLERTNRSRLNHFELFGFALKKLHDPAISTEQSRTGSPTKSHRENRMWATGAMPIGAPEKKTFRSVDAFTLNMNTNLDGQSCSLLQYLQQVYGSSRWKSHRFSARQRGSLHVRLWRKRIKFTDNIPRDWIVTWRWR